MDSSVPSIAVASPSTLRSTFEVSINEMEMILAGREACSSIPEVPAKDPDMLTRDAEASFKELSMLRAESLMDINEVLALATWPRIGLRAVSILASVVLIDRIC